MIVLDQGGGNDRGKIFGLYGTVFGNRWAVFITNAVCSLAVELLRVDPVKNKMKH